MPIRPQQHDCISGYIGLLQYHELTIRRVLLDSAHDNIPTYDLVRSLGAVPFIDLRMGVPKGDDGLPKVIDSTKKIGRGGMDARGVPHCLMGAMAGRGESGGYQRFDCPAMCKGEECPQSASCPSERSTSGPPWTHDTCAKCRAVLGGCLQHVVDWAKGTSGKELIAQWVRDAAA